MLSSMTTSRILLLVLTAAVAWTPVEGSDARAAEPGAGGG
jgi:hypothetical protein